jgi:uncharacterized membrane protein YadS
MLFGWLGRTDIESGYTIGAGISANDAAGYIATFTKLLRVALLPVVVLVTAQEAGGTAGLPWFVMALLPLWRCAISCPFPRRFDRYKKVRHGS